MTGPCGSRRLSGNSGKTTGLFEFHDCNARFPFSVFAKAEFRDVFLFFQEIVNPCAELSGAHAVHNPHFFQIGQHGGIEKGFHFGKSFLDGQADDVDFQAGNGSRRKILAT